MSSLQEDAVRSKLLRDCPGEVEGVWQIYGEDPNCDFGGPHIQPLLATVQGKYAAVVEHALGLGQFFTWGGGGKIERVEILQVDAASTKRRKDLNSQRQVLSLQLAQIDAELKKLGAK